MTQRGGYRWPQPLDGEQERMWDGGDKKAMTNGTIVINDPVTTRLSIAWPPEVHAWSFHSYRPIVSAYHF